MESDPGRRRPAAWLYVAAALVSTALLYGTARLGVAAISAYWRNTGHVASRRLRQSALQRAFYGGPYRKLMRTLAREHPEMFRSEWDVDVGVSLSRDLYLETPMYGRTRYRYRPHVHALDVTVWSGMRYESVLVPETPEITALVEKCDVIQRTSFDTDEHGFKIGAFPVTAGARTVLFVGDSLTEGLHVGATDTFSDDFGRRARAAQLDVVPVNAGVNGYGALEECWTVEHWAEALHTALVVVNLFPNDAGDDFMQVVAGKVPESNYTEMLQWLEHMRAFCAARGIALVVSAIPVQQQLAATGGSPFEAHVSAWCAQHATTFLDPLDAFRKKGARALYFGWDPHLHAGGHAAYAEFLFENLRSTLARVPPSAGPARRE